MAAIALQAIPRGAGAGLCANNGEVSRRGKDRLRSVDAEPEGERIRARRLKRAEHETLVRWVKNEGVPRKLRRRARVILLSSYGLSTYAISIVARMGRNNVARWVRRFNAEGPSGLYDRPRSGRPRRADGRPPGIDRDSCAAA